MFRLQKLQTVAIFQKTFIFSKFLRFSNNIVQKRFLLILVSFMFQNLSHQEKVFAVQNKISQVQQYRPDRPKDLFEFFHPELRKQFNDAINISRIWLEGILYSRKIYPSEAFQQKTAYAKRVYVTRSPKLRQYLDNFFESVCQNIQNIDNITIKLYEFEEEGQLKFIGSQKLQMKFSEQNVQQKRLQTVKQKSINSLQKEIEYKKFLTECQQRQKGYLNSQQPKRLTFRLLIGYRWKQEYKHNRHKLNLLQKWTSKDEQQELLRKKEHFELKDQMQLAIYTSIN